MKRRVLILGAKGMLGQMLLAEFEGAGYAATGWDRDDIDVTDFPAARTKIEEVAPDILINAVAHNGVDVCEENDAEYAKAKVLNVDVPRKLAALSHEKGMLFVHYSTDYVFDGTHELGYAEDATPHPISRYAETKRGGEEAVCEIDGKFYLIRLSKLFGRPATSAVAKHSFFEIMLKKGRTEKEVRVVDDEKSCFTYAPDLARATRELIESGDPFGIYHLPNEGGVTWYEAAVELYRRAGIDAEVVPVSSEEFPRPAKRPHVSVLLNTKRPKQRPYTDALDEFLNEIGEARW